MMTSTTTNSHEVHWNNTKGSLSWQMMALSFNRKSNVTVSLLAMELHNKSQVFLKCQQKIPAFNLYSQTMMIECQCTFALSSHEDVQAIRSDITGRLQHCGLAMEKKAVNDAIGNKTKIESRSTATRPCHSNEAVPRSEENGDDQNQEQLLQQDPFVGASTRRDPTRAVRVSSMDSGASFIRLDTEHDDPDANQNQGLADLETEHSIDPIVNQSRGTPNH